MSRSFAVNFAVALWIPMIAESIAVRRGAAYTETMRYRDREAAGTALAKHLGAYQRRSDVIVLGLLRGGLPVASAVAEQLALPLDALAVRKLGVPWAPEVAFGAVGPGGVVVLNDDIATRLDNATVRAVIRREQAELERRERRLRRGRGPLDLTGRTALVVDDGLATGATAYVALGVARRIGADHVVLAVPVGSDEAVDRLSEVADEVVCPLVPPGFGAVSRYYDDFGQVGDAEVIRLLSAARPD
jgi:predicted phosphoribosyltransferase